MSTKAKEPVRGTYAVISKEPKIWGARIPVGQGKKGITVELVNRYGARQDKVLIEKFAEYPANPYTGMPATEVWYFQNK